MTHGSPQFWEQAVLRECDPDAMAPCLGLSAFECAALMARARARIAGEGRQSAGEARPRPAPDSGTLRSSWLTRVA